MRPVAEAAATARPDCRRAFLNMVMGGSEGGRVVSLKERCNWEERRREKEEKRVVDGWEGRALFGVGRQARTGWH